MFLRHHLEALMWSRSPASSASVARTAGLLSFTGKDAIRKFQKDSTIKLPYISVTGPVMPEI